MAIIDTRTGARSVALGVAGCLTIASLSACQDALTGTERFLLQPETRAAIDLPYELPTIDALLRETSWEGRKDVEVGWAASWELNSGMGRDARTAIYETTLASTKAMSEADARLMSDAVNAVLVEVRAAGVELPPHLSLPFEEAERLMERAAVARDEGGWNTVALLSLTAADALRETGPKAVAINLIEAATLGLANPITTDRVSALGQDRADRLLRWARAALRAGDYRRAMQRAFYACQLLGVPLP